MRFTRKLTTLMIGGVTAAGGLSATVVTAPAAHAGLPIPGVVSSKASDLSPSVPGGQCYRSADQDLCRRVLVIKQIGGWIYAGGIISRVTDRITGVTTAGFHNIFRFSASTFRVDTSWKPQFYSSAQANDTTAYLDSPVTGIASDGAGTLYVAGGFSTFAPAPGAAGVTRRGVAAISASTAALLPFNAKICSGGGGCVVNDVEFVNGRIWLGGRFTHVAGQAITALAFVDPVTGALTGTQLPVSGVVTSTVGTKVAQIAVNPQRTQAVMIGNFSSVGGQTHKEVAVLDITGSGGATIDPWNDPKNLNASNSSNCSSKDTWARGVDWDPTGTFFDIAASGGGGFDAFGAAGALCDAFSRFRSDGNPNTAFPLIVNVTGFDSLYTVVDTGGVAYTGGHNKSLNHAVYINGVKVKATQESHYGIGAIDVNTADAGYGRAITSFNNSTATGRGAGWSSSLSTGTGVYIGGDAEGVGGDPTIKRLAFFPAG
ncbi:MAG TPA: hypothetical protein VF933_31825, partial [Streptosporangiaceae bacterium]